MICRSETAKSGGVMRLTFMLLTFFHALTFALASAMRLVLQRVKSASVTTTIDNNPNVVSQIGPGVMALVGLHEHDTDQDLEYCCKRLLACKLWENESGGMWRHSVKQKSFECLLVSQFTLYGTLSKKHQPDYKRAMKSAQAEAMYSKFVEMVRNAYVAEKVKDGVFGAMMDVALVNDGPVTLVVESEPRNPDADDNNEVKSS